MNGRMRFLLGVLAIWVTLAPPSAAMEIVVVQTQEGPPMLTLAGEILPGDAKNLRSWLALMRKNDTVPLLFLDSPGGNILEADKLATLIHAVGASVVVKSGDVCASACFLLFAASPIRYASSDALIGVHSASLFGDENLFTLDMTTLMARTASEFGVPPGVIGRMVTTKPSQMAWLTHDELKEMGVHFLPLPSKGTKAVASVTTSSTGKDVVPAPDAAIRIPEQVASKTNRDPANRLAYRPTDVTSERISVSPESTNNTTIIKPEGIPTYHDSNVPALPPSAPIILYRPGQ
jgi:hypothetical protein